LRNLETIRLIEGPPVLQTDKVLISGAHDQEEESWERERKKVSGLPNYCVLRGVGLGAGGWWRRRELRQ
jgi:hypothetical protein